MKKWLIVFAFFLPAIVSAQSIQSPNFWRNLAGILQPINNTYFVSSTEFCLQGSCIATWPSGGGGGSGSSTVIYGVSPIVVSALVSGNQTTSCPQCLTTTTAAGLYYLLTNPSSYTSSTLFFVTSGSGITTTVSGLTTTVTLVNTGNWAGTWQGVNSTTFYLASNPSGYITTSSITFNASGTATGNIFTLATSTGSGKYTIAANGSTITLTIPSNVGFFTNDANYLTANQSISLTGPVTGSGATTIATTIVSPLNLATINASTSVLTNVSSTNANITNLYDVNNNKYQTSSVTSAPISGNGTAGSAITCATCLTTSSGYSTSTGANPTTNVDLSTHNGTANTFMRSDAAPALSQSISPTWTGAHTFNATTTFNAVLINNSSTQLIGPSVAIGTSTYNGIINTVNASGTAVFQVSSSTTATSSAVSLNVLGNASTSPNAPVNVFQVFNDGHINATGTVPSVSSCGGGSPSVTGTDTAGIITIGSGAVGSCKLTFKVPYESSNIIPIVDDSSSTDAVEVTSVSSSSITMTFASSLTGGTIYYFILQTF